MGLKVIINKNDLESYGQKGVEAADRAALDACEEGAGVARSVAPKDTGALADSIEAEKNPQGRGAVITANAPYALYLEVGTSRGVQGTHFIAAGVKRAEEVWPRKYRL